MEGTIYNDGWSTYLTRLLSHGSRPESVAFAGSDAEVSMAEPCEAGEMIYLAPDTLRWERLEGGHAAGLAWVLDGGLDGFTEGLRWTGWEAETRELSVDRGLTFFPPLWSKEAHEDLGATSRAVVPMAELVGVARSTATQIGGVDPGPLGSFDDHSADSP